MFALNGLGAAWQRESSFRVQTVFAACAVAVLVLFFCAFFELNRRRDSGQSSAFFVPQATDLLYLLRESRGQWCEW